MVVELLWKYKIKAISICCASLVPLVLQEISQLLSEIFSDFLYRNNGKLLSRNLRSREALLTCVHDNWEVYFESLRPDYTCQVLIIDQTNTFLSALTINNNMFILSSVRKSETSTKPRLQSRQGYLPTSYCPQEFFWLVSPIRCGAVNFFRLNRTLYDYMYVLVGWLGGKMFANLRKWKQFHTTELVLDINVYFCVDELKFLVFFFEGNVD